ncbi:uncharacterized protein LOC108214214 isoform X2 [Daucus carota subsp. sativus]|nr:PREDICTED: uncharacterized protein LOC108214214 isoform X2 [Daucus carota subsp. sativus]XP_017241573.1 PREDICTED: uncharacterized protein LOC108214214 isoform X2 [Daucus carota subsp. sativus]
MRNLSLYTTNESWQVVNLKEARDFSADKKFIYLFKKLEWEYLSIDLLPHPDMFMDAQFANSQEGFCGKDDDGAKRSFFGGERFIEGISGEAYITIQRTELNSALGLEVQLHISEAVCPALSEPGLRALLRFLTGFYVCLNRGDIHTNVQQHSAEAAGRSLVSLVVDHIFLRIKDAEFQLELLMQSLSFSRASVSDGENAKYLTHVTIGGLFLRDTFSHPPCTLVQPPMQNTANDSLHIPDFAKNFCPPIYPLGDHGLKLNEGVPLINLCSLQFKPSPAPPSFASQTVIDCQPLMIYLQEESCLRICSFVADGIVTNPSTTLPDYSVNSLTLNVKELDVTVPLKMENQNHHTHGENNTFQNSFNGARLRIEALFFSESPSLKLELLKLEKDPACFCLWEDQPVDSSQKKWTAGASLLSLSLESCNNSVGVQCSNGASNLWSCVELKGACIEVAMATADGSPLIDIPPPGGIVRIGVSCQQYLSNTSIEQLFFVLDLYAYVGNVSDKMALVGKSNHLKVKRNESFSGNLFEKAPGDTAVSLVLKDLHLRFLESLSSDTIGMPLVQFVGENLSVRVGHRTLGGAIAISTNLIWETVEVECADIEKNTGYENGMVLPSVENGHMGDDGYHQLRAVFWVQNGDNPFLDVTMVHVIPYNAEDMECHSLNVSACIAGVRLGGGMNFTEALLHKFGILGPDGGPGEGLSRGLEHLSAGPLSKLFKASPLIGNEFQDGQNESPGGEDSTILHLGSPDDVDVSIEFKNWLFALEGAEEMAERWWFSDSKDSSRAQRCWHTTFRSLQVKAKSSQRHLLNSNAIPHEKKKHPIEYITIIAEGVKTLKPQPWKHVQQNGEPAKGLKQISESYGGINFEFDMVICEHDIDDDATAKWVVQNVKFSVKQPFEVVVTKDELQNLTLLCKSEVDSMGRISVGILRVLKLEGSVGQAAIAQLSNLGSEGFDNIFGAYNSNGGKTKGSAVVSPSSKVANGSWNPGLESAVASLEAAVLDSQATCAVLTTEMGDSETSMEHLDHIKQLSDRLESMQKLLAQLRP